MPGARRIRGNKENPQSVISGLQLPSTTNRGFANIISRQGLPVNEKENNLTIDDLKNVRRQKLRVESLQERIERLRSRAENTQQQLGECGQSDPTRDRLAEYVAELDGVERQLTGEMIALEKQLVIVDAELAKLPESQEKVLRLRYVEGMSWKKVAIKSAYCERQCRRLAQRIDQ